MYFVQVPVVTVFGRMSSSLGAPVFHVSLRSAVAPLAGTSAADAPQEFVVRLFRDQWPKIEVTLTESADDSELLSFVERGELDLTFADLPLIDGPFDSVELLRDPYVLVVPADSELALRPTPPSLRALYSAVIFSSPPVVKS